MKSNKNDELVRLSKLMSERNLCSRREADVLIERGEVLVDGKPVSQLGSKVSRNVKIELRKKGSQFLQNKVTILINKPIGYVSAQAEDGHQPAIRLVTSQNQFKTSSFNLSLNPAHTRGLAPAGRLDIDSKGLLILTQDGVLAKKVIGENSRVDKEYLVKVEGLINDDKLKKLTHGLELDGKKLKEAHIYHMYDQVIKFTLREGRKRQIRRMCELVDLKVIGLKRVRIGKLKLGHLPEGCWRFLEPGEDI